jgi:hypothetical protein
VEGAGESIVCCLSCLVPMDMHQQQQYELQAGCSAGG